MNYAVPPRPSIVGRGAKKKSGLTVLVLCFVAIVFDGYDLVVYGSTVPTLIAYEGWDLDTGSAGLIGSLALVGMLLGTLNVFFRDVGQAIGIVLTFWFWLTPIVYPLSILPPAVASFVTNWNPMTRIITGYHDIALNNALPDPAAYVGHAVLAAVLFALAYFCFKRLYSAVQDYL